MTLLNSYIQLSTIFRSNKNLKELLAPSQYLNPKNSKQNSITSSNKCDICINYMVFDRTVKCAVTGKVYYIKGEMNFESTNIIYLITCMKSVERYVASATKFKSIFRIHKSDIKTKKIFVGLLSILITNAAVHFYICVSSSLRKYIVFMMTVILKIFYRTEKNIDNLNYL